MLPPAVRLTSSESFRRCVRAGRRAGSRTLVVHLDDSSDDNAGRDPHEAQVGFVVSRSVGGAVLRNLIRRRLRHLMRERLPELPDASVVVVRANPASSVATYDELRRDLGRCLQRVLPAVDQGVGAGDTGVEPL